MNIKNRILTLCEQRYMSLNKLAEISCLNQSTLQNIISRDSTTTVDTIEKVCEGLNITLADFFTESELSAEALEELRIFKEYLHYKYMVKDK